MLTRWLLALVLLGSPASSWAAAPVVASISAGTNAGGSTNHTMTYPASIAAGNGILSCIVFNGTPTVSGLPSGSTQIANQVSGGGTKVKLACFYQIAAGGETSGTVTTATGAESVYQVYRLTGPHATSAAAATTGSNSSSLTTDPPSATASWGAEDNLFVAVGANQRDTVNAYPAGYTGGVSQLGPAVTGIASARKATAATATDNPGTFTWSSLNNAANATIVVRPSSGCSGRYVLISIGC